MLKEEHLQIRESVREFVEREVKPIADELDNAEKEIPMHVIGKMAELGYFGLIFPSEYGGMGLGAMWGEQKAQQMLSDAGFTSIEAAHIDGDIFNTYFIATKN